MSRVIIMIIPIQNNIQEYVGIYIYYSITHIYTYIRIYILYYTIYMYYVTWKPLVSMGVGDRFCCHRMRPVRWVMN